VADNNYIAYALNFLAFGNFFSPVNTLSAPTFLPLLGQPCLRATQDENAHNTRHNRSKLKIERVFIRQRFFHIKHYKPTKIIFKMQAD
jgi:hypothetical protein